MKALVTYLLSFALLTLTASAGIKVPVINDYANNKLYNNLTRPDTIYPKHAPVAKADIKSNMLGIWRNTEGENAVFEIKPSSIYYFEHAKGYSYKVTGNVLTIKFPDFNFTGKVSFVNNIMIIDSKEYGVSRYKKMK